MKYSFLVFLFFVSSVLLSQNDTDEEKKIDSLSKSVDLLPSDKEKVKKLTRFIITYRTSKLSKKLIDKSIAISKRANDPILLGHSYYALGSYYYYQSQLDSAMSITKKANELISTKEAPLLKASILNLMGAFQKAKGDIPQAINTILQAKRIIDKIDTLKIEKEEIEKYKGHLLIINNTLANFYSQMENYKSALLYYDNAYQAAINLNAKVNAGIILTNKGDLFIKMKKYKDALKTLNQAKKRITEGKAPPRFIATTNLNMGIAYFQLKEYKKAEEYLNKAYAVYNNANIKSGITETLAHKGILFNALSDFKQAKENCEKAKLLALTLDDLENQLRASECLYEAYKGLGSYQKALQNHEFYLRIKDSIFNEKNIKKITQIEMQYDFDKTQELQKIETAKKEQQRKLYLFLALIGLFVATAFGSLFIKNRKKNILLAKQKQLLEVTVDEKNSLLKEIHHRVKNNLQVISSLLRLQQRQMIDPKASQALQEGRDRVKAMALIHQNLYQDTNLIGVDVKDYVTKLANSLVKNYAIEDKNITIKTKIENIKLDVDTIIPLGLIINELISNALKYAFNNKDSGEITIAINKLGNGLNVAISDNGGGLPKNFDSQKTTTLGFRLIKAFTDKLKATLKIDSSEKGTHISFKIPTIKTI